MRPCETYIWADEAGDFTFKRGPNISKYFYICTVSCLDHAVGEALAQLRRDMVWEQEEALPDFFHATSDKQHIRDRVYSTIMDYSFKIQVTVCEKSKALPKIRESKARFYKYPWYYHFKHGLAPHLKSNDRLHIMAASIGTKKEKMTFVNNLRDVIDQSAKDIPWAVDFRPAQCETHLQVADYCAWAIQRKWETGDARSYDLIKPRITYEYDLWERGTTHYY